VACCCGSPALPSGSASSRGHGRASVARRPAGAVLESHTALLTIGEFFHTRDPELDRQLINRRPGILWLLLYLGLAVVQSDELAAWVPDAFLAFAASIPALLAWLARSQVDRGR
jgi:hypothetical protein